MRNIVFIYLSLFLLNIAAIAQPPVHEEKFITIGGIEQWVTINGADCTKPVVLFLHGGPGSVMSPYENTMTSGWEKDFILVHWDQRGAGRTFGRNAPADVNEDYWIENPLTVEQMASDGIELSEYLINHLNKEKLILIGTSWGSVLGVKMAQQRPDLFAAYIGHAQIVNPMESLANAYEKISNLAQQHNDTLALGTLKSIGPPPYPSAMNSGKLFRIIKKYERQNEQPAPEEWWDIAPEYQNEKDSRDRYNGDDYSFINYVGHAGMGIKPMMAGINFMEDALIFDMPVYFIQGENDILTPKEITEEYFRKLSASKKEFLLLPNTAHGYNQAVIDAQYKILKEYLTE